MHYCSNFPMSFSKNKPRRASFSNCMLQMEDRDMMTCICKSCYVDRTLS